MACAFGGNALYLASLGNRVDAVNVSALALAHAQGEARRRGLQINLIQADLARWWVPQPHHDLGARLTCEPDPFVQVATRLLLHP